MSLIRRELRCLRRCDVGCAAEVRRRCAQRRSAVVTARACCGSSPIVGQQDVKVFASACRAVRRGGKGVWRSDRVELGPVARRRRARNNAARRATYPRNYTICMQAMRSSAGEHACKGVCVWCVVGRSRRSQSAERVVRGIGSPTGACGNKARVQCRRIEGENGGGIRKE